MLGGGSNSNGSPNALFRKATLRLLRDGRVRLRGCRISPFVVTGVSFLACIFLALRSLLTRSAVEAVFPNAFARAPKNGFCSCKDGHEWHRMKRVLASSDFVARAFIHDVNNRSRCPPQLETGFTCVGIHTLFRGSPRFALYPVVVSNSDVHACSDVTPGFSRDDGSKPRQLGTGNVEEPNSVSSGRDDTFLIVGGIANLEASRALNATILKADRTCTIVWVIRWTFLADDVREAIASEPLHADGWWRYQQTWRDPGLEWWSDSPDGDSVSIVAACKNRHETLHQAAETWTLVRGVSEIVLLDFGSSPALRSVLSQSLLEDSRFVLASAPQQTGWALGRAYNAAIQLASSAIILKVDCDVILDADFLEAHPLRKGEMYAGDWRALRSNEEAEQLHVNGLLLAFRDEVIRVGGYDERVITYGWDDSDIAARLGRAASPRQFDYAKVHHLSHSTAMRIENQRQLSLLPPENYLAPLVETQRNRLLLTRCGLHSWREDSTRLHWNAAVKYVAGGGRRVLVLFQANTIANSIDLVSQDDEIEMSKRAIRLVLLRYGVSLLPKTMSLGFFLGLAARVGFPERYVHIDWHLRGGCAARLVSIAASRAVSGRAELWTSADESSFVHNVTAEAAAVSPPHPQSGWHIRHLWQQPDVDCSCRFLNFFVLSDVEITPGLHHLSNSGSIAAAPGTLYGKNKTTSDVRSFLQAVSEGLVRNVNGSQTFSGGLACDIAPQLASIRHREALRNALRAISPTSFAHDAVMSSLGRGTSSVLDHESLNVEDQTENLGAVAARGLQGAFADASLRAMIGSWSAGSSALHRRIRYRLEKRAVALCITMMVPKIPEAIGPNFSRELKLLKKQVADLFLGCPGAPEEYLKAYPELAVIVAAMLSSNICVPGSPG